MRRFTIALAAAAIGLPALAQPASLTVELRGPEGEDMGVATLTEGPRGVLLRVEGRGLTPGWHGLHFHEKGDCSSADFKSAGGHVHDAAAVVHGFLAAGHNDAGDLPNLHAATVGGGTRKGTAAEAQAILGVGSARELACVTAATLLAGEINLAASFLGDDFVAAHERLGRNRP